MKTDENGDNRLQEKWLVLFISLDCVSSETHNLQSVFRPSPPGWGGVVPYMRVSMGLTDRRKTAQNLVDSRKNWKILTVSRK